MKKVLAAALIAATALTPVVASAQGRDWGRSSREGGGGGGGNPDFRRDAAAFRAQQQQARPAPPQQAQPAPRPQWNGQRGDQRPDGQRTDWRGGNAGRDDGRRGWDGSNGRSDPRDPARQGWRGDRGNWQGNNWQGNRPGTWQVNRLSDWRGNDGGWNDRQGFDDRRAWNRGWRNDDRYGWRDYRSYNRDAYRLPRYYAPSGWSYGYRRFGIGFSLSTVLFSQRYWIDDPYTYRLPPIYGPYRWVRYYNDALLVDIDTGRVVDVEYDIFW